MKTLRFFGIMVLFASILIGFQFSFTGFATVDSIKTFDPVFIITFLLGISMIAISGNDVTGGLEKALDDDVSGVVTFVRHGEKDAEGNLTEKGKIQARKLGTNFKAIYDAKNEGNLYLATSSSPFDRVYEMVKEIVGVESRYNKPIARDERLYQNFDEKTEEKIDSEYERISKKEGKSAADNWYINSKYGEKMATDAADFLDSNKNKFDRLQKMGKNFHYIAGTHEGFIETLLKRVIVKDGKTGVDSVDDIGGTLDFAEPVNFLLKKDGSYQVNFRGEVYDVDMNELGRLAKD